MRKVRGQEVNRSERTWKWWKRDYVFELSEPDDKIPDERLTPLHEFLQANHYDVNVTRTTNFMGTADDTTEQEQPDMSTLDESIKQLLAIEGATGAAVVDYSSGMALAQGGNPGFDLGVAAAGNSNVVSAKLRTMAELSVDGDIEDILNALKLASRDEKFAALGGADDEDDE